MVAALFDDSQFVRILHHKLIEKIDKKIILKSYDSGESFLKSLKDGDPEIPDLVITDYDMKKLNGIDVIKKIDKYCIKNKIIDKLKVYLVSSNRELKNAIIDCASNVYQGFIPKPLTRNHVINIFTRIPVL